MRIQTIISLGKTFAILGLLVVALIGVLLLIYNLIAKLRKRKKVTIPIGRLLLYAVFIVYIVVVVGATMLRYSGLSISWENREIYPLFYSYKEAWNHFSAREWRNIILNIMMFVPFGFLLPLVSKKFQIFWKTYLTGFLFTFLIEMTQLLFNLGICELDDFMNNTVGAMIGYGFYRLFMFIVKKWKKQEAKVLETVCFQIPVLVTLTSFAFIFGIYEMKELGNLPSGYIVRQRDVQVTTELEVSSDENTAMVYRTSVANVKDTRERAEEIFGRFGLGIDESRTDIYEDTAIYYSEDNNRLNIWINYAGQTYSFTDYDALYHNDERMENKSNVSEGVLIQALEKMGVTIPKGAVFEEKKEEYYFTADKIVKDGKMYDGSIQCEDTTDGMISHLTNNIIEYEEYKSFPIISEKEAFDRLKEGYFRWYGSNDLEVLGVELSYELDTKGFYQPVYAFSVSWDDIEHTINIPAIQK
ncbi:MAG: VanZ family protein [Lachnospiraceae bacterium]|nr:VanZ family protein [Lachnospiraceae bacterium]